MRNSLSYFDQYSNEYVMQQLLMKLFLLLDRQFDWLLVFDNKYFDFFQLFRMKNHFHQQINLYNKFSNEIFHRKEILLRLDHSDSRSVS
jgi:hypothetical protein